MVVSPTSFVTEADAAVIVRSFVDVKEVSVVSAACVVPAVRIMVMDLSIFSVLERAVLIEAHGRSSHPQLVTSAPFVFDGVEEPSTEIFASVRCVGGNAAWKREKENS